ncbi:N(5)-(carboxyethyl)ornithine synthase [Streptomyces sp. ALI-76-A]|jgi:alanine dehydrogenase|uniref:N(5)-(carboxyethyl)ornithine synthase n=1 Tax=Streptomyces sp. ALI-76-A TaxID=3025736 RepID=UPI00256ED30B|nr:N(5)-(carboxyethyl)ornithine synthase [Streptomyces sp. ALI-76-A]MDL5205222.1 N(5)-(carboxyethyl)ornithine synthase [Streptomyces sp. ALI-76-A]
MSLMSLGVFASSRKENEFRLPLHPAHLDRIAPDVREKIYLEEGYGERFGVADDALRPLVAGLRSRARLLDECDVLLLPKPMHEDVAALRQGQVLWGWPHCVQDGTMTQLGIDRQLTLIAWEAMNHWTSTGAFSVHVFHKNNELAGYSSVLHALQLGGLTGSYGRRLRAVVISFGATARGAVTGLGAMGVSDVTVLTQRAAAAVASPMPSVVMGHFEEQDDDPSRLRAVTAAGSAPLAEYLAGFDIVVNCVLQDTDAPLMFVTDEELALFRPGTFFVDVSCDEGMGFAWARPTTFGDPMHTVGPGCHYYAVDHSPSHLWNSATWEISEAILPYLRKVMSGSAAWEADATISKAIEMRDGVVRNPKILSFQRRAAAYPHPVETPAAAPDPVMNSAAQPA